MPHELPEFDRRSTVETSCAPFEQRVQQLLDERLAPEDDAWVQSQVAHSHENQQLLSGQQLMLDGLEMSEVPELSNNFAERCVAAAMDKSTMHDADARPTLTSSGSSRGWSWRITAYAATICALLAIIAAEPLWSWLRGDPSSEPIVENPSADTNPAVPPSPTPEIPNFAADDMPQTSGDSTQGSHLNQPGMLAPLPESIGLDEQPTIEELFHDLRERIPPTEGEERFYALVEEVRTGLRPVTDSVGGALNALRRNIPPAPKRDDGQEPQAWMKQAGPSHLS